MIPLPQIEGKYEILEKFPGGGMGAVYKVRHRLLDEIRVVKVMRPEVADKPDMRKRFEREAKAATRLKHPNIAQIYDFSVDPDGFAYMVIEYIDGVTLRQTLEKSGPSPLDLTLEIARQGLRALAYLHQQRYVHRDIAPDNLMVTRDYDGKPLVKLIDLGIVKHLEGGGAPLTEGGMFLGKARYSSPEQFAYEKGTIDKRSDLYSFGVMLYELLTGSCPIQGNDLSQLAAGHLFRPPVPFEETDPKGTVPREIREAVMQALEKDLAKRIASAEMFLELLSRRPVPETLSQELEQTLSTTINVLSTDARTHGGSTQDRLDANFGLVRTPPPGADLRIADPVTPEQEAGRVSGLVTSARRLAEERRWADSRQQLFQALALEPGNTEARALLSSVEVALQAAIEQEKLRQQEIERALERVQEQLAAESPEGAAKELELARGNLGEDPRFASIESRIAEQRGMMAERARQIAISEAISSIEASLRSEDAAGASAALAEARREHGLDPRFAEVGERIDHLAAVLETRRRDRALEAACATIARLLGEENAEAARAALETARSEHGPDARLHHLDARLGELRAVLAERGKQLAIAEAAVRIDALLLQESADEAAQAIAGAFGRFGRQASIVALERRLAELRRSLAERSAAEQAAARREHARALLTEAAALAAERELAKAVAKAEQAVELEPDNAAAKLTLLGYRAAEERQRAERRRREEIERAVSAIDSLLKRERVDEAEHQLSAAIASNGDDERLVSLRDRIESVRATVAARGLLQEIARAVESIEGAVRDEALADAERGLTEAIARFGEAGELLSMRPAIEGLRVRLAERDRRDALAKAAAGVDALVRAERLEEASRALEEAIARFGPEPRFEALGKQVVRLRADLVERERIAEETRKREEETRRRQEATLRRQEEERRRAEEERLRQEADRRVRAEQEERRRREEEKARREQAGTLLREAAALVARGDLSGALETAGRASDLDPEAARPAIDRYQREVEAQARAQRLQVTLSAARREIAAEHFDQALTRLSAAQSEHAASAELQGLVAEAEAGIARLERERKRRESVEREVAAIGRLLDKRDLDRAAARLARARAELGDARALAELDGRLESSRAEERRRQGDKRGPRFSSWAWSMATAGVALMAAIGGGALYFGSREPTPTMVADVAPPIAVSAVAVPPGESVAAAADPAPPPAPIVDTEVEPPVSSSTNVVAAVGDVSRPPSEPARPATAPAGRAASDRREAPPEPLLPAPARSERTQGEERPGAGTREQGRDGGPSGPTVLALDPVSAPPASEGTGRRAPEQPETTSVADREPTTAGAPAPEVPAASTETASSAVPISEPEPLGPVLLDCRATGVVCAEVVSRAVPGYPQAARRRGLVADVEIAVLVDERGQVIQATTRKAASLQAFNDAALAAARSTRFQPATKNGVAGRAWMTLAYRFAPP